MNRLWSIVVGLLVLGCGNGAVAVPNADSGPIAGQPTKPAAVTDCPVVVAEGDSLTAGKDSWAHQTPRRIVNVAKPGDALGYMVEEAVEEVDPVFEPGAAAVLWGGTNDEALWSTTAERLHERATQWADGRQRVGFRVLLLTMLPRGTFTPVQEATRQQYLAALKQEPPAGATVVDVSDVPGVPGDGVLWLPDRIHLTAEGQLWLLENRIEPALHEMCGN